MPESPAIEIRDLHKSYGHFQALRGINLEVQRGEVFGFLGPNGAGKTTAIRCLLDLIRPSGGHVRVLGIDPQHDPVSVRERTGYLPGELSLDDRLTARQALQLFDRLRGNTSDWKFIEKIADDLQLDLSRQIKNFSKGNKQKVGVIQAFMHRPELLLLDEPTSGLDPLIQQGVLDLVRGAQSRGATVFFSSHVLSEVQEVAARVAIVRAGEIIETSDTDALIKKSYLNANFSLTKPLDPGELDKLPGITLLHHHDRTYQVKVEGPIAALLEKITPLEVITLETERPSLEEIFLNYY
ncbi:MAG: ABC-2 type transport system ATP-binding protein [Pseudoalteromonas tetraodonis]|jgi:ABC-2 type transport system ATP-binding protein